MQLVISPIFHSKYALDVNGHIALGNMNVKNLPYGRIAHWTGSRVASVSNVLSVEVFNSRDDQQNNPSYCSEKYGLFYARSGAWRFSVGESKRNMPTILGENIVRYLVTKGFKVILIGDTPSSYLGVCADVVHINSFKDDEIPDIFKNSSFVVGSASGATHFPSFLFNLQTLYFASMPLAHLDAIYMPVRDCSQHSDGSIPMKERWVFADSLASQNELVKMEIVLDDFLYEVTTGKQKRDKMFKYEYKCVKCSCARQLLYAENGNITFV